MPRITVLSLIFIAILLLLDAYVFQAVRTVMRDFQPLHKRIVYVIYWSITAGTLVGLIAAGFDDYFHWNKAVRVYFTAFVIITLFSKLFVALFLLIDDIIRLVEWVISLFQSGSAASGEGEPISRKKFLSILGLIVGAVPFITLTYGMAANAYNYTKRRVKLPIKDLPDAFEGWKIVQISDIHSGSFTRKEPINEAIRMINEEKAELFFFTGDLVNQEAREMQPYMDIFSKVEAKHKFSIFGNHDYGDYVEWPSKEAKLANRQQLMNVHEQLGWKLLLNEHAVVEHRGSKLAVVGVENWSMKLRFPRYGDLTKAMLGTEDADVKLLLSHDPSHWKGEVLQGFPDISAMFSGHTHGFQFGIEIPGIKWSPVQYVYEHWAGLYRKGHQSLYVNRGFGFLAYPGRVGMLPEITVFELTKA